MPRKRHTPEQIIRKLREAEVELAKRIEAGNDRVLRVVLDSPIAIQEVVHIGDRLRRDAVPSPQPPELPGEAVIVLARLGQPAPHPVFGTRNRHFLRVFNWDPRSEGSRQEFQALSEAGYHIRRWE